MLFHLLINPSYFSSYWNNGCFFGLHFFRFFSTLPWPRFTGDHRLPCLGSKSGPAKTVKPKGWGNIHRSQKRAVRGEVGKKHHLPGQIIFATSHDRFPPNGGLVREFPAISGKSRLVKYYNLARLTNAVLAVSMDFCFDFSTFSTQKLGENGIQFDVFLNVKKPWVPKKKINNDLAILFFGMSTSKVQKNTICLIEVWSSSKIPCLESWFFKCLLLWETFKGCLPTYSLKAQPSQREWLEQSYSEPKWAKRWTTWSLYFAWIRWGCFHVNWVVFSVEQMNTWARAWKQLFIVNDEQLLALARKAWVKSVVSNAKRQLVI